MVRKANSGSYNFVAKVSQSLALPAILIACSGCLNSTISSTKLDNRAAPALRVSPEQRDSRSEAVETKPAVERLRPPLPQDLPQIPISRE